MLPKLLVIGHARHGKDTVCELLRDLYNFSFTSSSEYCCENIIYPALREKYNYNSPSECFADRVNHRAEWFNLICEFNAGDPAKLGREMLLYQRYDIYCGLRNAEEMHSMNEQGIYDIAIWVEAGARIPTREDSSSMTITSSMADYIIDNNGTVEDLVNNVRKLMSNLGCGFGREGQAGVLPPVE